MLSSPHLVRILHRWIDTFLMGSFTVTEKSKIKRNDIYEWDRLAFVHHYRKKILLDFDNVKNNCFLMKTCKHLALNSPYSLSCHSTNEPNQIRPHYSNQWYYFAYRNRSSSHGNKYDVLIFCMCVCVCVYVCAHIFIYVCVQGCVHTHTHTHTHYITHKCVYIYISVCVRVSVCVCVWMQIGW